MELVLVIIRYLIYESERNDHLGSKSVPSTSLNYQATTMFRGLFSWSWINSADRSCQRQSVFRVGDLSVWASVWVDPLPLVRRLPVGRSPPSVERGFLGCSSPAPPPDVVGALPRPPSLALSASRCPVVVAWFFGRSAAAVHLSPVFPRHPR